jgi:hypothetical protein
MNCTRVVCCPPPPPPSPTTRVCSNVNQISHVFFDRDGDGDGDVHTFVNVLG